MDILVSKQVYKYMILTETTLDKKKFINLLENALGRVLVSMSDVNEAYFKLLEARQYNGLKINEMVSFYNRQ